MASALANTVNVRRALSGIKLAITPVFFFFLPVYGISHGIDLPVSKIEMMNILEDWYDLVGTQTSPPDVKPVLYLVLALSSVSDLSFLLLNRERFAAWLQVSRVLNLIAGVAASICGELILQHVASNTLPPGAGVVQSAKFGSMISVLMILLIVPALYEFLVVIGLKTPDGD